MAGKRWDVFALFSNDIGRYDLRTEIQRLNALGIGRIWPLSAKKPDLGFLIYEVKESLLDEVLIVLNKQPSVKFASALPRRVDPSEPRSSCSLKKDK